MSGSKASPKTKEVQLATRQPPSNAHDAELQARDRSVTKIRACDSFPLRALAQLSLLCLALRGVSVQAARRVVLSGTELNSTLDELLTGADLPPLIGRGALVKLSVPTASCLSIGAATSRLLEAKSLTTLYFFIFSGP